MTASVPHWFDFIKADKEHSKLQQASELARSHQHDCENTIRSNEMRLEMLKFVHDILESKKIELEGMDKEEEETAQKFVGHSFTLDMRHGHLFDYCKEIEEQKYDLHDAIADACFKRKKYKQEADEAETARKSVCSKLQKEYDKLVAEAKKAASKQQKE